MCDKQSLRSACAYAQSDQSLCLLLEYSLTVKLLAEQHLEFLSLKGGCTDSSVSTLVKMPHFWKSPVMAPMQSCLERYIHIVYLMFTTYFLYFTVSEKSEEEHHDYNR